MSMSSDNNRAGPNKNSSLPFRPSFDLNELALQPCRDGNVKARRIMGEEASTVAETLTRSSEDSMENSYQLDFDHESPVRPPRRWSSMNNQSMSQLSSSSSGLAKPPKRCSSSSGSPSVAGNPRRSLHESMPELNQYAPKSAAAVTTTAIAAVAVTATTSSGSFLRSNFKAQTKCSSSSLWQFPSSNAENSDALEWRKKLKENRGGAEDPGINRSLSSTAPDGVEAVTSSTPLNETYEAIPEWKQKFLEMKGSSSAGIRGDPEICYGQATEFRRNSSRMADDQKRSAPPPNVASVSATPEWKRKFLQMKVATAAAQARDAEAVDDARSPTPAVTRGNDPENVASPMPAWKKSVVKTRQVQAELLSLGLKGSVDAKPSAAGEKMVVNDDKSNDGTPEWMRKFQSMRFEKEETIIEAGGKQDPGVVTNGNGVVVSWARIQANTATSMTAAVNGPVCRLRLDVANNEKSIRSVVAEGAILDASSTNAGNDCDQEERSVKSHSVINDTDVRVISCQLCDKEGHSAKECPQLLLNHHVPHRDPSSVSSTSDDIADEHQTFLAEISEVPSKGKKKKKKKTQCFLGASAVEPPSCEAEFQSDRSMQPNRELERLREPALGAEVCRKSKIKQKKATSSEEAVDVAYVSKPLETPDDPVTGPFQGICLDTETLSNARPPQDPAEAKPKTKKKRKEKLSVVAFYAETDPRSTPAPHCQESSEESGKQQNKMAKLSAGDTRPEPDDLISATDDAQRTDYDKISSIASESAMHESFTVSELRLDPVKTNRKKKAMQGRETKEAISEFDANVASESQGEVIPTLGSMDTLVPFHESGSSAGESTIDLHSDNYALNTKKSKKKRQGKREPNAAPLSESCSSLESSVASSRSRRKPERNVSDDEQREKTCLSAAEVVSTLMHESFHDGDGSVGDDETMAECQEAPSIVPKSRCDGSKSSSSRESTISSKSSGARQGQPRPASRIVQVKVLEEKIQIVNTLNAFLERSKERMSNRESKIPEGSLRANTDDRHHKVQQTVRRVRADPDVPSEGGREVRYRKKPQSTVRKSQQRKPRAGQAGAKADGASIAKKESSRPIEANRPTTPSSRRRRLGAGNKGSSSRRVARDPEPDITPGKEPDTGQEEDEEVFQMVYCNTSFQMSRQKICLPTDFDDFEEADLSDAEPPPNGYSQKLERCAALDDAFASDFTTNVHVRTSNAVSTCQSPFSALETGNESKDVVLAFRSDNDIMSCCVDEFSVDPFGPSSGFGCTALSQNLPKSFSAGIFCPSNSLNNVKGTLRDDFSVDPFGDALCSAELHRNFTDGAANSTSGNPPVVRRMSVESYSLSPTAKPTRRPSADGGPTQLSRRKSVNSGRSRSFQASR